MEPLDADEEIGILQFDSPKLVLFGNWENGGRLGSYTKFELLENLQFLELWQGKAYSLSLEWGSI